MWMTLLQIYHQKKEAHERDLLQQRRDAASERRHDDKREVRSRLPAVDERPLMDVWHRPSESQLVLQLQQMTIKQQQEQDLPPVGSRVKHNTIENQTLASSMPLRKLNVRPVGKQPQSFPDRLALIQKQKQMEESRTFARSSVRALKVSSYINLNSYPCSAIILH